MGSRNISPSALVNIIRMAGTQPKMLTNCLSQTPFKLLDPKMDFFRKQRH